MRAHLLGGARYEERIGPLMARVVLTIDGGQFFWRVEVVTGVGAVGLEYSDGTSKKWALADVKQAQEAAREFAGLLVKKKAT